jgi:hypothetical protein
MKLMGWLMSHDVGTVVRPIVPAWHDDYWYYHDLFQHDLFIAPGDEGLAAQIREVSYGNYLSLPKACKELIVFPEPRHRYRAAAMPSADAAADS